MSEYTKWTVMVDLLKGISLNHIAECEVNDIFVLGDRGSKHDSQ
jgi:hypothetical protein